MTTAPTLRKRQNPTLSPSRRIAVSQRIVASDPVIERLGPRSTPIRSASTTFFGGWACARVVLAIRPAGLPAEYASALPTVGLTALPLLRAGGFHRGDVALVTGATGGVGGMVVPMLAEAGVHVIATASPADDGYVRGLGANETVDYRVHDIAGETLRRHPAGVDAVINLALRGHALASAARTIRPGGRLLNIVFPAPDPAAFDGADLTVQTIFTNARSGDLDALAGQALHGSLPVTISRRYRLADGVTACTDLLHAHTRGKLVIAAANEDAYLG